jgi:hypothetical protein
MSENPFSEESYDPILTSSEELLHTTIDVSQDTLQGIREHGHRIVGAERDVRSTSTLLEQSTVVLQRMTRRALYNRLFIYFLILALLTGNIVALYFKLKKN